jgi:hypothetical protein
MAQLVAPAAPTTVSTWLVAPLFGPDIKLVNLTSLTAEWPETIRYRNKLFKADRSASPFSVSDFNRIAK